MGRPKKTYTLEELLTGNFSKYQIYYYTHQDERIKSQIKCDSKHADKRKAWRESRKEKTSEYNTEYAASRIDHKAKRDAARWARDKEKLSAQRAAWGQTNPDVLRSLGAKRRATELQAVPFWANAQKMREIYAACISLSFHENRRYHVDHIVPLKSDLVCGLHWEGNLQILEASANMSKSNKIWPDMSPWTPELRKLVRDFKQANNK